MRGSDELAMRLESVTELLTSIRRALADLAPDGAALRPCVDALAEQMHALALAVGHPEPPLLA